MTRNNMILFGIYSCMSLGFLLALKRYNNNQSKQKGDNMSVKSSVVDLLNQTKSNQQNAVGAVYDNMITSVQALPDDVDADVTELQDQITELQGKLDAAQQVIAADAATLTEEKGNEAKLQAKIDAIKAALAS